MARIDVKIAGFYVEAEKSRSLCDVALKEFDAYCTARDWPGAEAARLRVISYMEAYCDAVAAVYKTLERG